MPINRNVTQSKIQCLLPNISIISAKIATPVKSENKEPATGVKENEGSYHQEEENAEPDVL